MENTQWRELLQSFIAVANLYLSEGTALRIVCALQGLDEEDAGVFYHCFKSAS